MTTQFDGLTREEKKKSEACSGWGPPSAKFWTLGVAADHSKKDMWTAESE